LPLNSKIILIISIITISCGLKRKPKAPQGTSLPSIPPDYSINVELTDKKPENSDKKQKKK
tara:strand:- start:324 stop:506 length:183 start_codon:yes stop_codon:yes gene_type:complete